MNNLGRDKRVGDWIQEEGLYPENGKIIIWPAEAHIAKSISQDTNVDKSMATGPNTVAPLYSNISGVIPANYTSHKIAEEIPGEADGEYGWALAEDTKNSLEDGLKLEEALDKIASTSEEILNPGGCAIYNLESTSSRSEIPVNSQMEFASEMEDVLENYTNDIEVYEDPDFRTNSVHLVWRKPE